MDGPQPLRRPRPVLRLRGHHADRQPGRSRRAIPRIQKHRRDAVHHRRLAEARRDGSLRTRRAAAGAAKGECIVTTTPLAPRAFNREMYHDHRENVFYGTDDGAQDGSGRELAEIEAHYNAVAPARPGDDIHMISVVGGLYGLNMIPLWKPKRITIFDINPAALSYFKLIRQVWTTSRDVEQFLARLTAGDYDTQGWRER